MTRSLRRRLGSSVMAFVLCLTALSGCGVLLDEEESTAAPSTPAAPTESPTSPSPSASPPASPPATPTQPGTETPRKQPNIVVVLMDDFSMDLVRTMRSMEIMGRRGASYDRSFVVDSLCCVSRSSFFTGQYPRQTGVRTNTSNKGTSDLGGWPAFTDNGNEQRSFNVRLQEAGYRTAFVGKYLNEYEWVPGRQLPPVVPGWSAFNVVFGSAYDGWDFYSTDISTGGLRVVNHPAPPADASDEEKGAAYAGTVIEQLALEHVRAGEASDQPYFLKVAVYAPHNRTQPEGYYPDDPLFPTMLRDRTPDGCGLVPCAGLGVTDLPGFGDDPADNHPVREDGSVGRAWNTGAPMARDVAVRDLRDRARMAQSVDRTVRRILHATGDNTYVVFTSDNGFHLGQLGLGRGKGTAYATDAQVPLYVVGPGVKPGVRREVTSNIDLASTFEDLAGLRPAPYRAGRSLVPTFGDPGLVRRRHTFFEHTQQTLTGADPDAPFTGAEIERIPSYTAVRSRDALLIRLDLDPTEAGVQWGYEYYDYRDAPFERRNTFADPARPRVLDRLMRRLVGWDACQQTGDDPVPRSCRQLAR